VNKYMHALAHGTAYDRLQLIMRIIGTTDLPLGTLRALSTEWTISETLHTRHSGKSSSDNRTRNAFHHMPHSISSLSHRLHAGRDMDRMHASYITPRAQCHAA
jgi:hypothetical protein